MGLQHTYPLNMCALNPKVHRHILWRAGPLRKTHMVTYRLTYAVRCAAPALSRQPAGGGHVDVSEVAAQQLLVIKGHHRDNHLAPLTC